MASPADDADALSAEVARLRAERDQLAAEAARYDRVVHGGRVRHLVVGILVVLASISFLAASIGFWANRNLLNTDVWVERVGPLASDPAVQQALADELTAQVMALVDPEALFESVLPERGQLLAVPLANAVEEFVADRVLTFVESDQFAEIWETIQREGHEDAVALLHGEDPSAMLTTEDGDVLVSVVPAIDAILTRISEISPEIFGRSVDIPELSVDDLPDVAREKLSDALGVELTEDFGVITVYDGDALSASQQAIELFDRLLALSIFLTIVLTGAALIVSKRRRRTALQLLVGFSLGLVLLRRLVIRSTSDVIDLIEVPTNAAAVEAVLHAFADPLLAATQWILTAFVLAIVVLVLTGPYGWVAKLRHGVAALVGGGVAMATDKAQQDDTVAWVRAHATALQWGGGLLFVAALWWWDLSWFGLLVLAALIGGFELWVARVQGAAEEPDAGPPDGDASQGATPAPAG